MLDNQTLEQLRRLRLSGMAAAFATQVEFRTRSVGFDLYLVGYGAWVPTVSGRRFHTKTLPRPRLQHRNLMAQSKNLEMRTCSCPKARAQNEKRR
jgi:hypothetical protein